MSLPPYAMNTASFPEIYEHELVGPLFRPWAERMVSLAAVSPGDRVLDIACGTGIVARTAMPVVGDRGRVVGVDVSGPMLAVARAVAPEIDWREGSATALPLGEGEQFDVVCCQQGLQFVPDRACAATEMRRALAPGGRVAVATWRPVDEVPLFHELKRIAERHVGPIVDQRHAFGDGAALARLLTEAGFTDVRVETERKTTRFADGSLFVRLNTMALVGMSDAGKAMSDDERRAVVGDIARAGAAALPAYADGAGIAFELSTNIATGRS